MAPGTDEPTYLAYQFEKWLNEQARKRDGLSAQELMYMMVPLLIRCRTFFRHDPMHVLTDRLVDYAEEQIEEGHWTDEQGNRTPFVTAEMREDPGYKAIQSDLDHEIPDFIPEEWTDGTTSQP